VKSGVSGAESLTRIVMRYKLKFLFVAFFLCGSLAVASEPHPYLVSLAREVQVPQKNIKTDLVSDSLTFLYKEKSYSIDELEPGKYPVGMKEMIGPSPSGFVVRISVGPKSNLPMSLREGVYGERRESTRYWVKRLYGFETPEGSIAISVSEGPKVDRKLLTKFEAEIKSRAGQWKLKE